jgi:hypothetical protein
MGVGGGAKTLPRYASPQVLGAASFTLNTDICLCIYAGICLVRTIMS